MMRRFEMNTHWTEQAIAVRPTTGSSTGVRALWKRAFSLVSRALAGQQQSAASALRIEERLSLGPKKMLFLVDCSGKQFLVATGAETIVSMIEISGGHPVKAESRRKKVGAVRMQQGENL
jgi:hypothetical protein